jgi:cobalt/nickel transport protein
MLVFFMAVPVLAHFQVVMPDRNIVSQEEGRDIHLSLLFTHPFEQYPMNMEKPAAFGVLSRGEKADLLASLKGIDLGKGLKGWEADYTIKKPGDYIFYVEPVPYWEPAEDCYIVHLTKTVVNAFGMEEGWDEPVGLQAEIIPLTRPYGLWAGNIFQGKVMVEGEPAAGVEVEVEFYNDKGSVKAPSDTFITQVVKTDEQGIFSYVMPWEGWWGFAALTEGSQSMKSPDDRDVPLELGAVLWVRTEAP